MKIDQMKIPVDIQSVNWKLVRERDELTKHAITLGWIEWDEDGKFKQLHDTPEVGRSLMLDPHPFSFTWQCTDLTEIIEQREDYIKFKTLNSVYELFKIN